MGNEIGKPKDEREPKPRAACTTCWGTGVVVQYDRATAITPEIRTRRYCGCVKPRR